MEPGSARVVTRSRRALFAVLLAALALAARAAADPADTNGANGANGANGNRTIVLGFDGADWTIVDGLIEKGELPHLAALREKGTGAPLGTTVPAESPVSWAALNCGQNPGKTGIPGFIKRELSSSGEPSPALGFQVHAPRATASFRVGWLQRQLIARRASVNAAIVGVIVALGFLLLLARLLRIRAPVSSGVVNGTATPRSRNVAGT